MVGNAVAGPGENIRHCERPEVARQSRRWPQGEEGLPRRFTPRNDGREKATD